jgi:hypothetical protein
MCSKPLIFTCLLIFVLVCFSGNAQTANRIKSITHIRIQYEIAESGDTTQIKSKIIQEFDSTGNMTTQTTYPLNDASTSRKESYSFYPDGKKQRYVISDESGNVIVDERFVYIEDSIPHAIVCKTFDALTDRQVNLHIEVLDREGNVIKEEYFFVDDSRLTFFNLYNPKGQGIYYETFLNDEFQSRTKVSYNDHGDELLRTIESDRGNAERYGYHYSDYDINGNWTRRYEYKDGGLLYMYMRELLYYKPN